MIKLAIKCDDREAVTGLSLDTRECERHRTSYTVSTLLEMREEIGADLPIVVTLGMDSFNSLPQWHRWEEILSLANLLVLQRPGTQPSKETAIQHLLKHHLLSKLGDLLNSPHGGIWIEHITPLSISATDIRKQIATGHSARYLLPDSVWSYIKNHGLYGFRTTQPPQSTEY